MKRCAMCGTEWHIYDMDCLWIGKHYWTICRVCSGRIYEEMKHKMLFERES